MLIALCHVLYVIYVDTQNSFGQITEQTDLHWL